MLILVTNPKKKPNIVLEIIKAINVGEKAEIIAEIQSPNNE